MKTDLNIRPSVYAFFLLCSLLCFSFRALPQALAPTAESAFEPQLPFNTAYIKSQKIRSITFDILDKKDFQVAEDKGLLNYYEFNTLGLLSRYYYTSILKVIEKEYHHDAVYRKRKKVSNAYTYTKNEYLYDTVSTTYFYDNLDLLKLKRYNDGAYYESKYYTYSPANRPTSEMRFKETNVSENKAEFKLGTQTMLSEESFEYMVTGKNQYKRICKNDEGRIYKEIIFNYNDAQQLTGINEQYTATWISQTSEFKYNAKGQLISAVYKSNANGEMEQSRSYEYDSNDCLLTEKQFKNGVLLKEISYVTGPDKKLNSYIIRDPNGKSMRIVKLIYQYY